MSRKKYLLTLLLSLSCLMGAFAFYKMNPQDSITPWFFALGLLGIMMSVLRNKA